jgi:hypothetical protein
MAYAATETAGAAGAAGAGAAGAGAVGAGGGGRSMPLNLGKPRLTRIVLARRSERGKKDMEMQHDESVVRNKVETWSNYVKPQQQFAINTTKKRVDDCVICLKIKFAGDSTFRNGELSILNHSNETKGSKELLAVHRSSRSRQCPNLFQKPGINTRLIEKLHCSAASKFLSAINISNPK